MKVKLPLGKTSIYNSPEFEIDINKTGGIKFNGFDCISKMKPIIAYYFSKSCKSDSTIDVEIPNSLKVNKSYLSKFLSYSLDKDGVYSNAKGEFLIVTLDQDHFYIRDKFIAELELDEDTKFLSYLLVSEEMRPVDPDHVKDILPLIDNKDVIYKLTQLYNIKLDLPLEYFYNETERDNFQTKLREMGYDIDDIELDPLGKRVNLHHSSLVSEAFPFEEVLAIYYDLITGVTFIKDQRGNCYDLENDLKSYSPSDLLLADLPDEKFYEAWDCVDFTKLPVSILREAILKSMGA